MQFFDKRLSTCLEPFLEALGAGAVAAGPPFGAVLVTAVAAGVSVLDLDQVEEFFPIGSFLLERSRTVTDLHPHGRPVLQQASMFHIIEVFVAGD
jgi:hypothetical protein